MYVHAQTHACTCTLTRACTHTYTHTHAHAHVSYTHLLICITSVACRYAARPVCLLKLNKSGHLYAIL